MSDIALFSPLTNSPRLAFLLWYANLLSVVPIAALACVYTCCRWTQCGAQNNLLYFLRFLAPSDDRRQAWAVETVKKEKKNWWEENFESSRARAPLSNGVIIAKFIWRKSLLLFLVELNYRDIYTVWSSCTHTITRPNSLHSDRCGRLWSIARMIADDVWR